MLTQLHLGRQLIVVDVASGVIAAHPAGACAQFFAQCPGHVVTVQLTVEVESQHASLPNRDEGIESEGGGKDVPVVAAQPMGIEHFADKEVDAPLRIEDEVARVVLQG